MSIIPTWKWSFGEPQQKSPIIRSKDCGATPVKTAILEDDAVPPPAEYTRKCGLRNLVDIADVSFETGKDSKFCGAAREAEGVAKYTQQEVLYNRMNLREKVVQIGQNPFRAGFGVDGDVGGLSDHQTNYIHDIEIQDRFLRGKLSC